MRTAVLSLLILLLPGCGVSRTSPELGPGQRPTFETAVFAPPEHVLASLQWVYRDLGLVVAEVQQAGGLIRSGDFGQRTDAGPASAADPSSPYYRCGRERWGAPSSAMHETATVTTTVTTEEGETLVRSTLRAARVVVHPNGTVQRFDCVTTGRLEEAIHDRLRRRVS